MSKQIEERVVSMQFDNSRFEKNVATSMSTLDKLKQKLNLSGASKGLDEVNKAASKVDMSGLSKNIETVQAKFSALDVVAGTVLHNITTKAIEAGERLVKSLTVDQVTAGWDKYTEKTASVQTIMNATGKSIDEVNAYLEKLMWFSDETSYGFTDMTAALASMTSTGGDIDKLIPLITGVANATAFAGKGASEFSRIMQYSLNQAYGTGYMGVKDWVTLEGTTVASEQLKQILIDSAVVLGKLKKGEVTIASFRDSLKDQWLDTEVMEEGFGKFAEFSEAVYEAVESGQYETATEAIAAMADQYDELGVKAFQSGQQAKTFTEAIEATKDAVSSGWMTTFELIFGNYEEATKVWTRLCNWLWDTFAAFGEIRNAILESTLGKSFTALGEKISGLMDPINGTVDTVKGAIDTVKDYGKVVDEIIADKWGNAPTRWQDLTEAGYDWAHAQNLVNERLGCSVRHATDYTEATDAATKSTSKATEVDADRIAELCKLSDAELEALGYTKEQIEAFRELEKAAKKVGLPIEEFINKIDEIDGRWLLLEGFANIGNSLTGIFTAIKTAWQEIFNPNNESMIEKIASKLFDLVAAFHKFTRSLLLTDTETGKLNENGEKLKRVFKGVFAIFDIVTTIVGGPLKLAFKIITKILGAFGITVLDVAAYIGDAIVKFRDWFKSVFDINGVINKLTPYLKKAAKAIREWFASLKDSKTVKAIASYIKEAAVAFGKWIVSLKDSETIKAVTAWIKESAIAVKDWIVSLKDSKIVKNLASWLKDSAKAIKDWMTGLKEADSIPEYIIQGLWNGLKNGVSKIVEIAIELGAKILESIKKVLGIHSPSKEMEKVGENTIAGFLQGIKNGFSKVWEALKNFGSKCIEIVKNIDFGALLGVGIIAAVLIVANKLVNVLDKLVNPLDKLGGMFDNIGTGIKKMCTSIGTNFKAKAFERVSNALLNFAKAIGILVVAVIALTYVAKNNSGDMWEAFGMIASLAAVLTIPILALAALAVICKKNEADFENVVSAFGKIGRAFLAIAIAIAIFGKVSWGAVGRAGAVLGGLLLFVVAIAILAQKCKKIAAIDHIISTFGKIAKAFAAIAAATFIFNIVSWKAVAKAGTVLGGLLVFVVAIAILAQKCKKIAAIDHVIDTFMKIAKAFLVIAAATFIFNIVSWTAIGKAGSVLGGLLVFIAIVALIAQKCKKTNNVGSIGDTLWDVAKSMLILALVVKLLGSITWPQLGVAAVGMLGVLVVVGYLMKMLNKYTKDAPNIGKTLLAIAGAMAILAIVVKILGSMSLGQLGVAAVGMLGLLLVVGYLMKMLNKYTKDAPKMGKTLLAIAGAMAILAAITVILGLVKLEHLAKGVGAVLVLGIIMAVLLKVASKAENAMKPVLAMVALIAVLGTILILLAKLTDTTQLITAAACLAGVVIVLAAAMAIIGKFAGGLASGGALLLAAAGLLVIAAAMCVLAAIPGDKIAQSIGLIVVALLALCAVAAIFHFFIAGATALVGVLLGIAAIVVAVGIAAIAFAGALYIVGLALPLVADGLVYLITSLAGCYEHAGKFVVVCLALFAGLILLAIPLVIIAAGILIIGVAFGLVAVSALVFVAALTVLALILPLLSAGLEIFINTILQFSDRAGEIVVTLLALAAGIAALGIAAIIAGAGVIVFGVGLAICAVALVVVAVAALLVVAALWAISYVLPSLIENVASCSGSMDNFKTVMSTVGESVLGFLLKLAKGLLAFGGGAIVAGVGAVVLAVGVAVLAVAILIGAVAVLALAAAFYLLGKALDVTVQAAEAGKNLVLGFAQGIVNSISTVINTVKDFCSGVVNSVKEFLGIHSPSTIMQQLGLFTGEGFALGLDDSKAGVSESAEGLAQTAKDGMSDAGAEGGSAFSTGVGDSIDLSFLGDGFDVESLKSSFGSAGSDSGSAFSTGVGDSIDLSSLTSGEGLDFSSLKSSFGSAGSDSGSSFTSGLTDNLNGTDSITADVDANQATVISKYKTLGSDSATAFNTGLSTNLDLSKVNIGSLDTETMKRQFTSAGTVSGASFTTALRTALSTLSINDKLSSMLTTIVSYNPKMKQAGTNLGSYLSTGLKSKKEAIVTAGESLVTTVKSAIKNQTQYEKFVKAGKYLGAGLVAGIEAKESAVYWAAYALGQAAVQGELDGQDSESPSKATIQAGKWLGEGLVMGIKNMGTAVSKASSNLGEMATGTISKAVSTLSDAINSDIDAQPTIRPVLDLSDVRAGAGSINALFSGRTLAVDMAGVGAVSASMANRQNGNGSNEIVSSIKALRKDIANMPRNTYTVNGLTYDDGTNVSNAVGDLVRAARIERRT